MTQQIPIRVEILNYKKDGETFWAELEITPAFDELGKCTHFVAIQRDVTLRKKSDLAIRDAERKKLQIQMQSSDETNSTILSDPFAIKRVVTNLIGNAIKFTSEGIVEVAVTGDSNAIRVTVSDSGPGFSKKFAATIFEPFSQEQLKNKLRLGGTGLGLAISRRLARALHGELTARSSPGEGSVFELTLPKDAALEDDISSPSQEISSRTSPTDTSPLPTKLHILVAEDNLVNQKLMSRFLKCLGCSFDIAENGLLAVDAFKHGSYDVILMDIQMPELDGWEAAQKIRELETKHGKTSPVHIIAQTAFTKREEVEKCLTVGMDDHLSKPITMAGLRTALCRVPEPIRPSPSH